MREGFNTNALMLVTELNLERGIALAGGEDEYMAALDGFMSSGMDFLYDFTEADMTERAGLVMLELPSLQAGLNKIQATELIQITEQLMMALNNKRGDASKQLFTSIRDGCFALNEKLKAVKALSGGKLMTAAKPKADEAEQKRPAKEKEKPAAEKPSKPYLPLTIGMFDGVEKMIGDYQLVEAISHVEELIRYSYDKYVDTSLERLYKYLSVFDQLNASLEVKKLSVTANSSGTGLFGSTDSTRYKILAIDDNIGLLDTLRNMLKNKYTVFCIPSADEALHFLEKQKPDLIFLDIDMPEMDGFLIMSLIRQMTGLKYTPIVFISGNATMEHIAMARDMGASDFIRKPIDKATLEAKIDRLIR